MPTINARHKRFTLGVGALLFSALLFARAARSKAALDSSLSAPLQKGAIQESVYGIGTVAANRSYQMKTGVTSTVLRLFVKEGDEVKRGARLVELDGIGLLTAPFDGTVTALNYKVGETVFSQSVILTLTNLSDRYLTVSLEQQAALRVTRGMPVRVSIDTMREKTYSGSVEAVYSNGTDFLARIVAPDLPARVLPGMTADVAVSVREKPDVLLIPTAALTNDGVWVKRGGGAPFRVTVKTGIIDGDAAELVEGDLRPGDRLMLGGGKS